MEYEVRFYFNQKKVLEIINKLNNINLKHNLRMYEKTIQYDHPNTELSFYSKEIDGRFRVRYSINDDISTCKLSWKRRLENTRENEYNVEEEKELNIDYKELDNLLFIVEKVLKMKKIESYERYRTTYTNNEIEISIDEYPFGTCIEIESKINDASPIIKYVDMLNIDIKDAYRLSWDDKYQELCNNQNIVQLNNVEFDTIMPRIEE